MADAPLPHCPVVTMGWDSTLRCELNAAFPFARPRYPYDHVVVGNTPERFGRLCRRCRVHRRRPERPPAVLANAWNEWTEGSYFCRKSGTARRILRP